MPSTLCDSEKWESGIRGTISALIPVSPNRRLHFHHEVSKASGKPSPDGFFLLCSLHVCIREICQKNPIELGPSGGNIQHFTAAHREAPRHVPHLGGRRLPGGGTSQHFTRENPAIIFVHLASKCSPHRETSGPKKHARDMVFTLNHVTEHIKMLKFHLLQRTL